jgi:ABC-type dipeptide/oligopeptide/nickel transport system ATPase component/ABC-type dipeptide/oligopeptide/nickel transport system permease subunit
MTHALSFAPAIKPRGFLGRFFRRPGNVIATAYLAMWVILGFVGQRLTGFEPKKLGDLKNILSGPSSSHWLGTDAKGKDTLHQLIVGAQIDLRAAAVATVLGALIGVPLGLAIGFARSSTDNVAMRFVEALQAIPGIILITTIITVVGRGIWGATVAIAVVSSVALLFTTRAEVRRQRDELYVASATVLGVRRASVALRHVLPNVLPIVVIVMAVSFGGALLGLSGLSLLGFGQAPPTPSWGTMLQTATISMERQWFAVVPPGLTIASVVFAVNTIADGVRGALGRSAMPRTRSSRRLTAALGLDPATVDESVARSATPADGSTGVSMSSPSMSSPTSVSADVLVALVAAHDGGDAVLVIDGLTVERPTPDGSWMPLVRDISLSVARGKVLGIVGESGSGKSLTVSAAVGITPLGLRARARTIAIAGTQLQPSLSASTRRHLVGTSVGMIFQNPLGSLNPTQRVRTQVAASVRAHRGMSRRDANQRTLELLRSVGIDQPERVASSYPHQLSGGMAQRVMIASALAGEPDLLIADECTTALDVTVQAQVIALLRSIADAGTVGVVFITHDLAVVTEIADDVVVMRDGHIVERGTVSEVFTRPQHPYTLQLLAHVQAAGRSTTVSSAPERVMEPTP